MVLSFGGTFFLGLDFGFAGGVFFGLVFGRVFLGPSSVGVSVVFCGFRCVLSSVMSGGGRGRG